MRTPDKQYKKFIQFLIELGQVINPESIYPWLSKPNELYDGMTPLQLFQENDTEDLWEMVNNLQEYIPE
jgi:hypothetical protein